MTSISTTDLQIFLDVATEAVLAAGTVLQDFLGKLDEIEEKGRPGDLVTVADRTAETVILDILKRHTPDHRILTEETGSLGNLNSDLMWAIDPLDGTTNYAHQYPVSAVSVGLMIHGEPAVGAIYDPFRQELFRAAIGLGATRNRRPIHVSSTSELSKSLLVTGFAYDRHQTRDTNYAEFCYLTHLTQGVRRSGSAAMDLAYTACGRFDGYWERGLSPWDMTAGIVILREAGGQVTAYDGSPFQMPTGRILATNGSIHTQLSQALQEVPPLGRWDEG
ncbi:MAG: inositol monophosphatase family protein [Leptolyngbyaceae cyanobacterium]|jgi:myo-inositol-1(or 4)-monophosphatase|uniref:inositol monophosphatase family protein n=1 Tax=Leptodesmis TaxID=2664261 RepID=UPI001F1B9126|nr:inositol monophosphatase family protein [Leptodesmis sichuanensis]UIE37469.1 inositol monophosphatase [Leptodesmis sichuanensis A121]